MSLGKFVTLLLSSLISIFLLTNSVAAQDDYDDQYPNDYPEETNAESLPLKTPYPVDKLPPVEDDIDDFSNQDNDDYPEEDLDNRDHRNDTNKPYNEEQDDDY